MKKLVSMIAIVSLLMLAASAQAQNNYYVDVTNDTGYTIMYLSVSVSSNPNWRDDILGTEVLMDGDTFRVNLEGYSSPVFDIRATDEDGDTYTFFGIDVSTDDLTITLADLDMD